MKRILLLCTAIAVLAGCQTAPIKPDPSILRVGVTPDAQPIIYKQGGQILGIEADFAARLGQALDRKVVFVEVPWDKQIDFLENNKTDIIMSGMSITPARSIRINFSKPYLQSGQSAAFRRDSYDPEGLLVSTIMNQTKRIGYVNNTTGEFFCMQRFTRSEKKGYPNATAAIEALKANKIDMFVHDAPVIWWLAAINEADVVSFPEVLNVEPLAWGISKQNMALLDEINALLNQWEEDGTSRKIIQNWIPNFGQ